MIRHKWKDNKCVKCGLLREKRYWKLLMAITDDPPYNHYITGYEYYYWNERFVYAFTRPDCTVITLKQVVKDYLKNKEQIPEGSDTTKSK